MPFHFATFAARRWIFSMPARWLCQLRQLFRRSALLPAISALIREGLSALILLRYYATLSY